MRAIRHPLVAGTFFQNNSMEFAFRNFQVCTAARNVFDERHRSDPSRQRMHAD